MIEYGDFDGEVLKAEEKADPSLRPGRQLSAVVTHVVRAI